MKRNNQQMLTVWIPSLLFKQYKEKVPCLSADIRKHIESVVNDANT